MNYDDVAAEYDRRYELYDYSGIRFALHALVRRDMRVLELGCGSGQWLKEVASVGCDVAGIDPSRAMLDQASDRVRADLRLGHAEDLPWPEQSFDLVLIVNALHHFAAPTAALREALRVLRSGGVLLSIGLDPHAYVGRWYVYDFFPEALAADLERFPSADARTEWLRSSGFVDVLVRPVEQILLSYSLEEALRSGVLKASFTSQLTALAPAHYSAGMERIHAAASASGEAFRLNVDLVLYATEARRPSATTASGEGRA